MNEYLLEFFIEGEPNIERQAIVRGNTVGQAIANFEPPRGKQIVILEVKRMVIND